MLDLSKSSHCDQCKSLIGHGAEIAIFCICCKAVCINCRYKNITQICFDYRLNQNDYDLPDDIQHKPKFNEQCPHFGAVLDIKHHEILQELRIIEFLNYCNALIDKSSLEQYREGK